MRIYRWCSSLGLRKEEFLDSWIVCCGAGLFPAQASSIHLHLRWSNPLCHRLKLTASVESAFIILPTVFQALLWLGPLNKEFCMSLYFPRTFWCSENNKNQVPSFLTTVHKPKQLLVEVETSFKVLAAHTEQTLKDFFPPFISVFHLCSSKVKIAGKVYLLGYHGNKNFEKDLWRLTY